MSFDADFASNVLPDIYQALGQSVPFYKCRGSSFGIDGVDVPHYVQGIFDLADSIMTDGDRAIDTIVPTFEASAADLDTIGITEDSWCCRIGGVVYDVTRFNRPTVGIGQLYLRRI